MIAFETGEPIPSAEVCVLGADTSCVRADARGRYRLRVLAGTVTVRFRTPGSRPALVRGVMLEQGSNVHVSCAMSSRISLTDEAACLPVPDR